MALRARAWVPAIKPFSFGYKQVVDARQAQPHQTLLIEFPVLVAVAAKPLAAVIMPLIGEAHRDAILAKRPEFLDQPIIQFPRPLAHQECLDGAAALEKFRAVAPAAVFRIGERHAGGVLRIPG